MKKSIKKALAGTALAGAVIIGAGASTGTFSDFFAESASTGNSIETGTLKLEGTTGALFAATNLQPGSEVAGQTLTITNAGTLPGKLAFTLDNFQYPQAISAATLADVKVDMKITYKGQSFNHSTAVTGLPGLISAVNAQMANHTVEPGETITVEPTIKIDRHKDKDQNALQGVKLGGDLSWKLNQL